MNDLTTIILTYNEEKNIRDCILSIKNISKKIYIVDSFSTDNTVKIAEELGAIVLQHPFENQSRQFKFAMNTLDVDTTWVLRLDADERFTKEASDELTRLLIEHETDDVNGIVLRFEVTFLGKKLRYGGVYPFTKMSVYRNGFADIEDKAMDEHFFLLSGKSIEMKNDCEHNDYKDVYSWIEKHNKYSSRESKDYIDNMYLGDILLDDIAKKAQGKKYGLYYRLTPFLRAKIYYLYKVFFKFAWLDGRQGLIYAFLHAYWYRYLVDVKIYEASTK